MKSPLTTLEFNMYRDDEIFLRSETYLEYLDQLQENDEVLIVRWGNIEMERVYSQEWPFIRLTNDDLINTGTGVGRDGSIVLPPVFQYPLPHEMKDGLYWEDIIALQRIYTIVVKIDGREAHVYYMMEEHTPLFGRIGVCYPKNGGVYDEVKKKLEYFFSRQYRHTSDLFEGWTK